MVCTGNICRSTMAHAILQQEAARADVEHLTDLISAYIHGDIV